MVGRACAQLSRWNHVLGHDRLGMAVNVPPGLLTDPAFPDRLTAQVVQAGLHPRQLTLEITEDALLDDPRTATSIAEEPRTRLPAGPRRLRHRLLLAAAPALDPARRPEDRPRLHRYVDSNPQTRRFVKTLITMAHDLGLQVIVEGVERQDQADVLRDLGATHAQGYLYARAAPADQIDLEQTMLTTEQFPAARRAR